MNTIQSAQVNNTLQIRIGDLDYFEEITKLEDVRVCGGAANPSSAGSGAADFNSAVQQQKAAQEQSIAFNMAVTEQNNAFSNQSKAIEANGDKLRASNKRAA